MTRARHVAIPMPALDARENNHAAIRRAGHGDKLDRLIAMLAEHRAACEEVIRIDDAYCGIRARSASPTGSTLGELRRRARGCILAIDHTLDDPQISGSAYGSLGDWGRNGQAPRIESMLRSARFHAGVK